MSDNTKNLEEQRREILSKWGDSGLLDGIQGMNQDNIATLLENQQNAMLEEVSEENDAGRFDNIAFPIVQQVAAQTIAMDLVAVQPMSGPTGSLFYADSFYGTYFKKPRLPRKFKKQLIEAFGRDGYYKWVKEHKYDIPWHRCTKGSPKPVGHE